MTQQNTAIAQPSVVEIEANRPRLARWEPRVGQETTDLLDNLEIPDEGKQVLIREALSILSRCAPPSGLNESDTGLVIGYVQSGKTMSFTALTALARDNGYQMIIVIAGISNPLFEQSNDRLKKELRLATRNDRKWQHFPLPKPQGQGPANINSVLDEWRDPIVPPSERQTVLITVMKNHTRLRNLIRVLSLLNLEGIRTLIVDDEADQAGLNTLVQAGGESTTYSRILELRRALPHNSYLQYTATPQAPLLINLIDMLSPDFSEVITPGTSYVGGREFFLENRDLIRTIPTAEIPSQNNVLPEPPPSLIFSMQCFFLGVAAGYATGNTSGNRSMMVHPSQQTARHSQYSQWVTRIRDNWLQILRLPETDPDRAELVDAFRGAYSDLQGTVQALPSFENLSRNLVLAIGRTRIVEINSTGGRTPPVDWRAAYSFILVGGQAMDRGFTVEGLTVTYMPRGVGVGNADSVQQRARFFGYKRPYLGFCRVYLEAAVLSAYRLYVAHEEDVRTRMLDFRQTGRPLSEWKRAFFLDPSLSPTRTNVLGMGYVTGNYSDDWFQLQSPHFSLEAIGENRTVVRAFLSSQPLSEQTGHPARTEEQKHSTCIVRLKDAYEALLANLRITGPNDSQRFTGLMLQIQRHLDSNSEEMCAIFEMGKGRIRERTLNSDDIVPNLFQGKSRAAGSFREGEVYPGDREIRGDGLLTIQFHNLRILRDENGVTTTVAENVPNIGIWVPARMAASWLSQNQGSVI